MNDRRTQAAILALVGATAMWLGLTDAALSYVRGSLRPPLVASGVVLLVLAAAALTRRGPVPGGHGHDHGAPRSGWLLALPVLVLLLVTPPALGSFAASRQAGSASAAAGDPGGAFPPLPEPVGGAVPLPVSEFVTRALYDKDRTLAGSRVRLLGFAAPAEGGGYLLTRFNLFCCAADGQAYQLKVRGDQARRQPDQWLVVEGRWRPQRVYNGIAPQGCSRCWWPTRSPRSSGGRSLRAQPLRPLDASGRVATSCNCIARLGPWAAAGTALGTRSSCCAGRGCG